MEGVHWLAIDTSGGTTVGVAHEVDGTVTTIAQAGHSDPRGHVEALAPMIEQVVRQADLTPAQIGAVAVGTGPAPFTGLRVGLASATAFAHATGAALHGVCSLDAIAWGVDGDVVVVTDARRREVYWAAYDGAAVAGSEQWRTDPAVGAPTEVTDWIGRHGGTAIGPALALYPIAEPTDHAVTVEGLVGVAVVRVRAGLATPLAPRYLRRPDIHTSAGRKRAS